MMTSDPLCKLYFFKSLELYSLIDNYYFLQMYPSMEAGGIIDYQHQQQQQQQHHHQQQQQQQQQYRNGGVAWDAAPRWDAGGGGGPEMSYIVPQHLTSPHQPAMAAAAAAARRPITGNSYAPQPAPGFARAAHFTSSPVPGGPPPPPQFIR